MKAIYMSLYIDSKERDEIKAHAKRERMSMSRFFIKAAYEKIKRDKRLERYDVEFYNVADDSGLIPEKMK